MTARRCARDQHCPAAVLLDAGQCLGNCDCHLGPHYPCSIEGGCGHLHVETTQLVGALIPHDRGLCDRCELTVSDAVSDLPYDYVSLRTAQYHGLSPAVGEVVSLSKDLPVPISLTFSTLADQIEVEVTAFAEPVAEKLGIDWDKSTTPRKVSNLPQYTNPRYAGPVILQKAAQLLASSTDILIKLPTWTYRLWGESGWAEVEADGVTAALTLLDLHQATRATLGLTRAVSTMQANCPWCNVPTLVRVAGDEYIHCQLCRRRFTDDEYKTWSLVMVNNHDPAVLVKNRPRKVKPKRQIRTVDQEVHTSTEGTVGRPVHREAM